MSDPSPPSGSGPAAPSVSHCRVAIVGAGLCGLAIAAELEARGVEYLLVDERGRAGGRILSKAWPPRSGSDPSLADPAFDLGPAWFWPGQPRMAALVRELGLESQVFPQFDEGLSVFEAAPGIVRRGDFGISMAGSWRLRGGMGSLVQGLLSQVPAARRRFGWRALRIERLDLERESGPSRVRVRLSERAGGRSRWDARRSGETVEAPPDPQLERTILCRTVVLACPPRIALGSLRFAPELPSSRRTELLAIPTWMASSAKLVALYETPFWRARGLSGDAFSQVGPLGEIHDASPPEGGPYALFGFSGLPPARRQSEAHADAMPGVALAQLARLFGPEANQPLHTWWKDWASDPGTATEADRRGPAVHSLESLRSPVEPSWQGRLLWAGSETASSAQRHNGYLEGALEAAGRTAGLLVSESA